MGRRLEKLSGDHIPGPVLRSKGGDELRIIEDGEPAFPQLREHGRTGLSVGLAHDERRRRFASPVAQADDRIALHDCEDCL